MFTGIVEEVGKVVKIQRRGENRRITIEAPNTPQELRTGDSVAVSGVCLTALDIKPKSFSADLAPETWERTSFSRIHEGALVNLERPLRVDGRLDGHFVTGHIDGTGKILRWEAAGADHLLEIAPPPDLLRYIVFKGSIAVDGISLTVAELGKESFRAWIIPHTFEATALRERKVGDAVNLEADLLGKYVERFLATAKA